MSTEIELFSALIYSWVRPPISRPSSKTRTQNTTHLHSSSSYHRANSPSSVAMGLFISASKKSLLAWATKNPRAQTGKTFCCAYGGQANVIIMISGGCVCWSPSWLALVARFPPSFTRIDDFILRMPTTYWPGLCLQSVGLCPQSDQRLRCQKTALLDWSLGLNGLRATPFRGHTKNPIYLHSTPRANYFIVFFCLRRFLSPQFFSSCANHRQGFSCSS